MRVVWLVLALVLAGCTAEVSGTPAGSAGSTTGSSTVSTEDGTGPVDLVVPVEMRPVLESGAGTVLPDPTTGESLTLADPMMTIRRLDGAKVTDAGGTWALILDLVAADTKTFEEWTVEHVGERVAMVVDGEVVIAPTIQGVITAGSLQIAGDYTQDQISDLLDKITGR